MCECKQVTSIVGFASSLSSVVSCANTVCTAIDTATHTATTHCSQATHSASHTVVWWLVRILYAHSTEGDCMRSRLYAQPFICNTTHRNTLCNMTHWNIVCNINRAPSLLGCLWELNYLTKQKKIQYFSLFFNFIEYRGEIGEYCTQKQGTFSKFSTIVMKTCTFVYQTQF